MAKTKGGLNSKIHLAVDAHGLPIRIKITHGTTADCTQALDLIREIEKNLGMKAKLNLLPFQLWDFHKWHVDVSSLINDFGYKPKFNIQVGVKTL